MVIDVVTATQVVMVTVKFINPIGWIGEEQPFQFLFIYLFSLLIYFFGSIFNFLINKILKMYFLF